MERERNVFKRKEFLEKEELKFNPGTTEVLNSFLYTVITRM